jgi:phage terminase large subunit-like protein
MKESKKHIDSFVNDVKNNPKNHCKKIKQLVSLIEKRLQYDDVFYDYEAVDRTVNLIEALSTYQNSASTKAGDNMKLLDWQLFLVGCLYGIKYKSNKSPVFTKAYVQVGKKNGKTTLISALCLLNLITQKGAEVIIVNSTYKLAQKTFETIKGFVYQNELLGDEVKNGHLKLTDGRNEMSYFPTSSKVYTFTQRTKPQGLKPSFIIFDEAALYKSNEIIRQLESGKNSNDDLSVIITTADTNKCNAAYAEYERSSKILSGKFPVSNYLPMIFELDEEDLFHWENEEYWIKANPSLGKVRSIDVLKNDLNEAKQNSEGEASFKAYCLNIWSNSYNKQGIRDEDWQCIIDNDKDITKYIEHLEDYPCCGGLDLSLVDDFTAYTLYFYIPEIGKYYCKHRFYIPEEQIERKMKSDSKYIRKWIDEGFIIPTTGPDGGKTINYGYIVKHIMEDKLKYPRLSLIGADPVYLNRVMTEFEPGYLKKNNLNILCFGQDWKKMGLASSDWLSAVLNKQIIDSNPVMAWMVSNADYELDQNKNIHFKKIDYFQSSKRIDGVITSIMSHALLKEQLTIKKPMYNYNIYF